ncbi:hypothetical protein DSM106972_087360 [Dulcicalothrix desertica PCC 7102]|uniref:Uncharacterized protein n=1 Tax=Dulcicalothrix desertica PCC 7102 TaxID=232991 RepID=A0A433URW5_9CYAN|nr:hypothetical protein [Dulcicalothrix desertica]RUS96549.1 hypothetical protein DSM106972_087360 [Dulcicalothrix desertica PCC 7102]TWH51389.1 hypothetical protein CAL7102_05800 [Dulcicalothrix desertica PCC 7102]
MSNRRLSSPYVRYLKARLWNLARPGFWGTALFLSVIGLTIREFWMRPDMLTSRQSKPVATQPQANSTLTAEDRAIAADIDNLPILAYDSEQTEESALDVAEPISQPKKGNQNPLQEALKNQNASNAIKSNSNPAVSTAPAPSFKYDNPFLTQAQNLLQFGNTLGDRNNRSTRLNTANSSSQTQSNQLDSNLGQGFNTTNSTQRLVASGSLEAALNPSSLTPLPTQTPFNQIISRSQLTTQPSNNNFNTAPQAINNSLPPTQFVQPITTQPSTYNNNFNGANPTQVPTYTNPSTINSVQPATSYSNVNGASTTIQQTFNTQPLPNSTLLPQTSAVTPSTFNTVTNPSASTLTPTNERGNATLTTPSVQPTPSQVPGQSLNLSVPVRY